MDAYVDHPLSYLPLAYSVEDQIHPEESLDAVIEAISKVKDMADFFCLVPIHQGVRFLDGGYQISSSQITQLENGQPINWETLVIHELPENVLSYLPAFPFRPSMKMQIRASIASLLIGMKVLIEQKNKIETLRTSENQFEVELYNRHKSRLLKINADFGIAVSKTIDYLRAEYSSLKEDINFKTLIESLKIIEEASQKEAIDAEFMSNAFDTDYVWNAAEQLLKK